MNTAFRKRLLDAAALPYRSAGPFAWHFARGKLAHDPVFFGLLRHGFLPARALRVLDLGCGQGLLANWLTAAQARHAAGDWPRSWPAPPRLADYHGIELMARDVARGRPAMPPGARIDEGDMCATPFGQADAIVILDSLHYIAPAAQDALLERVRAALAPGGTLLLRVGDAAAGLPFHLCTWVDRLVTFTRGHRLGTLHCRPAAVWRSHLSALGLRVDALPMSAGTPFANTLLCGRLDA